MNGNWLNHVACRPFPELFFGKEYQKDALHICRYHCPVAAQCHADSIQRLNIDCVVGGQAYGNNGEVLTNYGGRGEVVLHNPYCRAIDGVAPAPPPRIRRRGSEEWEA